MTERDHLALEWSYLLAFQEWADGEGAKAWDAVAGDGLDAGSPGRG